MENVLIGLILFLIIVVFKEFREINKKLNKIENSQEKIKDLIDIAIDYSKKK
jgi:hypothetical protein